MNRSGVGPQSLRGLPNNFPSQQQQLQQTRTSSNRLSNGKMAGNGPSWAYGGSQINSTGIHAQRSNNGPMNSFAQTIGGSPAPLDLSEFPSLSNNPPQQSSNSGQSTWALPTSRSLSQTQRSQQPLISTQQGQGSQQNQHQQDDLFRSVQNQSSFRFGGQGVIAQPSQSISAADDFPPLSGNMNGDMSQDRNMSLLQNSGFGGQTPNNLTFGGGIVGSQGPRNNGLLNALSDSIRAPPSNTRGPSPSGLTAPATSRSPIDLPNANSSALIDAESNGINRQLHLRTQNSSNGQEQANHIPVANRGPPTTSESLSLSQPGPSQHQSQHNGFAFENSQISLEDSGPEVEDPLPGSSDKDRFGLKGLLAVLKGPYPDQAALITGVDVHTLGLDLNSNERLSENVWSPWDDTPAKPDIPQYTLPECYQVHNVQSIDNKMSNFSDETLMFMFYSNPQDLQQVVAAQELTNRNWRYHKKLQLWLTKDDMMVPQHLGGNTERGYYVFFDPKLWIRERREFLLNYGDLEAVANTPSGPVS